MHAMWTILCMYAILYDFVSRNLRFVFTIDGVAIAPFLVHLCLCCILLFSNRLCFIFSLTSVLKLEVTVMIVTLT